MIRTSRRQHIRCRRQHLTPLTHKLQARVPKKEVEKERMGSLISGDTTHLPLQWGMSRR